MPVSARVNTTKKFSTPSREASGSTFDFAYLCHLLLGKAWVIILSVVVVLCAAIAYLLKTPRIYESRAVVEVEQETPRVINIQEINPEEFKEPEVLKTIEQAL